jgi:hypothetical protein
MNNRATSIRRLVKPSTCPGPLPRPVSSAVDNTVQPSPSTYALSSPTRDKQKPLPVTARNPRDSWYIKMHHHIVNTILSELPPPLLLCLLILPSRWRSTDLRRILSRSLRMRLLPRLLIWIWVMLISLPWEVMLSWRWLVILWRRWWGMCMA